MSSARQTPDAPVTDELSDAEIDRCYYDREKVATTGGVFKIQSVTVTRTVGNTEEILAAHWQAECPVCYTTHETESQDEDVRNTLFETVLDCCGIEWLPPSEWVEHCHICGTSHNGAFQCRTLISRSETVGVETTDHDFCCHACGWHGHGSSLSNFYACPDCGSNSIEEATRARRRGAMGMGVPAVPFVNERP